MLHCATLARAIACPLGSRGAVTFGSIFVLALGLAADATAVSATRGMAMSMLQLRHVLFVAGLFGGFQALMPLLGWALGARLGQYLLAWDHWIVFVLLCGIGLKMLWEARTARGEDEPRGADPLAAKVMLALALATSIDALGVGFTLPMLNAPLLLSTLTIGATTAVSSALAMCAGRRLGPLLGARIEMLGGAVLIIVGLKILVEHLNH